MSAISEFYDAYWFSLEGRRGGRRLAAYTNAAAGELTAMQAGLDAYDEFNEGEITLVADASDTDLTQTSPATLDASASTDAVLFLWVIGATEIGFGETAEVELETGANEITLYVLDADNNVRTDVITVTISA